MDSPDNLYPKTANVNIAQLKGIDQWQHMKQQSLQMKPT